MANYSPAGQVKQIDGQVSRILRGVNLTEISERAEKSLIELKQNLVDAKIYAQDYELSEMRDEQLINVKKAKRYLDRARQNILRASEFNIFGPADVAHLTAQIDQTKADLK